MADCSYARCLQERRNIKRELQRWNKNMVYVVGLERVAEELMGRRKWKLYQDVLLARNLPLQQPDDNEIFSDSAQREEEEPTHMIATTETIQRHTTAADSVSAEQEVQNNAQESKQPNDRNISSPITLDEDSKDGKTDIAAKHGPEDENASQKGDTQSNVGVQSVLKIKTIEEINTVGVDIDKKVKDSASEGGETILEGLIKRTSTGPPRRPLPADWTPQDKCYFCVDGELVRPGTTTAPEPTPDQPSSPIESESGSSSSRSGTSPPRNNQFLLNQQTQALAQLFLQQQARLNPSAMNQVQSMTASLAAIAALGGAGGPGLPPALTLCPPAALLPHWYLNARTNSTHDRSLADVEKSSGTTSLTSPLTTEQPLDLSSKSSTASTIQETDTKTQGESSSSLLASSPSPIDSRSKPRLLPTGGRRTYSDAELQAALRDIQSGRLGTRRAAVLYNIPRSTLRNKVYKLAVEREREARLPGSLSASIDRDDSNDMGDDMDDDKDSLMDEDKEEDKEITRPLLSMEDVLRFPQVDNSTYNAENLRLLLQKGGQKFFDLGSPKQQNVASELWPGIDPNIMTPYIQSLLLASGLAPLTKPDESTIPGVTEIVRLLAEEQQRNILKEQLLKQDHLNNGKSVEQCNDELSKRMFSRQSSSASSVAGKNERITPNTKTECIEDTPMDITDQDISGESRDSPSNVILKIPSFKPLVATPNSNKNGTDAFPGSITPPLTFFSRSPHPEQTAMPIPRTGTVDLSPPLGHTRDQMLSLRDVIAKSISQKFQQQGAPTNHNDLNQVKSASHNLDAMEGLNAFKRGITPPVGSQGISVIKNLTSHDLTRNFNNANNNSANQSQQSNATGGKGTRPKRGKYRNYDRDSLVEAVKAVQRGEMSVHRAGSYYGVPHSTLEYKVKERHLMRPRKREPKNINTDDKAAMPSASKSTDIPGSGVLRVDKPKTIQKPPPKPSFPANSPNGLKMPPMFDPALALGYSPTPFPFWPPAPPFHGLPVEFSQRNPGTSNSFPSESFLASQMMQRLHEESTRHPNVTSSTGQKIGSSNSLLKSARDMAEFYEGTTTTGKNGSFLEGIIRSSLEQNNQRNRTEDQEGSRRLRPDDVLLAEEMREAVRRVRARETTGTTPAPPASTPISNATSSAGNSPPHPT